MKFALRLATIGVVFISMFSVIGLRLWFVQVAEGPIRVAGSPSLTGTMYAAGVNNRAFYALAVGTSPLDAKVLQNNMLPVNELEPVAGEKRRITLPSVAAGVPEGIFTAVIGDGKVGGTLVEQPVDGIFFTGVRTTGIFCRPSCRARKRASPAAAPALKATPRSKPAAPAKAVAQCACSRAFSACSKPARPVMAVVKLSLSRALSAMAKAG